MKNTRIHERLMEGPKYGDSPTQTGKTVGDAFEKFKKGQPGVGEKGELVHIKPSQAQKEKKVTQVARIMNRVADRQVKNYGDQAMLHRGGSPFAKDTRPTAATVRSQSIGRFGRGFPRPTA